MTTQSTSSQNQTLQTQKSDTKSEKWQTALIPKPDGVSLEAWIKFCHTLTIAWKELTDDLGNTRRVEL